MQNVFYVAAGGAIGACMRYGLQYTGQILYAYFPWGTFAANMIGCFAAGYFVRFVPALSDGSRLFVATGMLGALTTLSTFSLEVVTLLDDKRVGDAILYWVLNAVVCVAMCGLGFWLAYRSLMETAS